MVFTILDILQLKKIDNWENIYSVNSLYLHITHASGYIEEINENKYLIFDSIDKNKELPKNTVKFLMELSVKLKKQAMMSVVIMKKTK